MDEPHSNSSNRASSSKTHPRSRAWRTRLTRTRTEPDAATGTTSDCSSLSWFCWFVLFYFLTIGMSAYTVCTDERKRDVNRIRNDLKQKLQYRAQCVKERSYSTAPITSAVYRHTMYTSIFTEREREQERGEKRRKRENANTVKIHTPIAPILLHTNKNTLRMDVRLCTCKRLVAVR